MPDVTTVEQLKDMFDRVYDSNEYQQRRGRWRRYLKEYMGDWWNESVLPMNESKVTFNLLFSTIETNAPLLTDNKPMWTVLARFPHHSAIADNLTMASRAVWDKLDLDFKNLMAVKDSQLFGTAIYKVYFDPDKDEIAVDIIDPTTFVIAPGYEDLWDAAWCGQKVRRPLEWVIRMYPDKKDELTSDPGKDGDEALWPKEDIESEEEFVTVYEIWMCDDTLVDVKAEIDGNEVTEQQPAYPYGRIVTFTEDNILLDDRPSPFRHGKPMYVDLKDYPVPHRFWAMGEADQIESLVREHNLRLQHVVDTARKYDKKNFILSEEAGIKESKFKEALRTGDNVLLARDFHKDMFAEIPTPQVDQSTLGLLEMIPKFVEEITGVTDVTKGIVGKKSRQSASEISALMESSYTRTRQRVRNLEWTIKRLLTLVIELMQQFYTEPRPYQSREGDMVNYDVFTSDSQLALEQLKPNVPEAQAGEIEPQLTPEEQTQLADYQKLLEDFMDKDEIHIKYELQIDTNSTLPLDKQSLANVSLRLAEMKILPEEAVLEILRIPNKDRYAKMLEQRRQEEKKQTAPPKPQSPPQPQPPLPGGG